MIYFMLPVYNEEDNIKKTIEELRSLMKGKDYKIVAVNDGSIDNSLKILNELKGKDLVVEGSVVNMNVGAVFSLGIDRVLSEAKDDDIMVIMESDQTSEVAIIKDLVGPVEKDAADIVIASRYLKSGGYVNFPFLRLIFSYCANSLMKFYFPIQNVIDYTIFFRAYRIGLVKKATEHFGRFGLIQSKGFVANAELLIKLSIFTKKIKEVPFTYNYGKKIGQSKINVFRTINEYFVLINYLKRIFNKVER
ncbi:MAG: hypothetical protein A2Y03_02430 [Omnitrophica WOR_2 bacterium GWF2_38_59]|nr:MAG: hypothetical protein A2Y03_02430 [Omnitrophica WOR_2 bacterium GWF2_38_59]OGX51817.1 MAG: hypothetical protein A2267_05925 [Omnitrophica WOR_2 bacterium RIFOXYA12_FULL_38_10]